MAPTTSAVLLTVGAPAADPALRGVLEPHGYTVEARLPNSLPEAMTGYAALILNGRDGASDVLEVGPVRFAVSYRPCGQVGGDFYDVFRLDEHHVGFYVADAMGHGVPASLLTIFLKKAVQPKEVTGSRYRLVPPGEVLGRLNRELIDQQLAQMPFITMVYGLLNCSDGR